MKKYFKKIINGFKLKIKTMLLNLAFKSIEGDSDYRDGYLCMQMQEGGEFRWMKYVHFTPCAITGDIHPHDPIRFYFKVVGFEDTIAPVRNWGMNFETFKEAIRRPS